MKNSDLDQALAFLKTYRNHKIIKKIGNDLFVAVKPYKGYWKIKLGKIVIHINKEKLVCPHCEIMKMFPVKYNDDPIQFMHEVDRYNKLFKYLHKGKEVCEYV